MEHKYYCVHDWMINELGLRGSEKDVFAVIFSFAESCGVYTGGLQYLCRRTGATKPTVITCLRRLLEKDLLRKQERIEKGVRLCEYRIDPRTLAAYLPGKEILPEAVKEFFHPGKEILPEEVKEFYQPRQETLHNNKENNQRDNKEDNKESKEPPQKTILRHKYGEYGNVLLSDGELDKLRREFPEDWRKRIDRLSEYMASTGKHYRDHLATIRLWAKRDAPAEKPKGRFDDLKGGLVL